MVASNTNNDGGRCTWYKFKWKWWHWFVIWLILRTIITIKNRYNIVQQLKKMIIYCIATSDIVTTSDDSESQSDSNEKDSIDESIIRTNDNR